MIKGGSFRSMKEFYKECCEERDVGMKENRGIENENPSFRGSSK